MSEIEKELKLSKKQNKNDRYDYLCSQFNGIEYAMKLEKYANKLIKENNDYKRLGFKHLCDRNNELQQQLKDKDEKISNLIKLLIEMVFDDIDYLGVYQELVARHLVKLGYIVKEDGYYKELESNKED